MSAEREPIGVNASHNAGPEPLKVTVTDLASSRQVQRSVAHS
jgi:hypothetical protein